jgi:uncharacterized protein YecE (DUF72 family)
VTPLVRLGTQGWTYPGWVGPFFPEGTPPARHLTLYARAFETVEVDSTFYAVPTATTVRSWLERTPPGFLFSPKMPREITHERRLRDAGAPLAAFIDRVRELGERLGPILIQLGPDFAPREEPELRAFLDLLPGDLRFAVEFRQSGWISAETHALLSDRGIALALSDGQWLPRPWVLALAARPTTSFHYVRWMGTDRRITDFSRIQIDRDDQTEEWAAALATPAAAVTEVFGYFNNYYAGHAPASVRSLQRLLGQEPVEPDRVGEQTSLF